MQLRSGNKYALSENLRKEIADHKQELCTIGDLLKFSKFKRIITVGDVTTDNVKKAGIPIFLQIVDLKSKRGMEGKFEHEEGSLQIVNEPGTLSSELFSAIKSALSSDKPTRIEVTGEEDLAVIPIIFYSELDTVVAYGVPDVGMACIEIDTEIKESIRKIISRMDVI